MNWLRRDTSRTTSSDPLWKEEFSVRTADERYVTRRQLTKFLVLTSFGMFVGNLWILVRSMFSKPVARIAASARDRHRSWVICGSFRRAGSL